MAMQKSFLIFLMFMKLWAGDWEDKLNQTKEKVDDENRRGGNKENRQFCKLQQFSRNEF